MDSAKVLSGIIEQLRSETWWLRKSVLPASYEHLSQQFPNMTAYQKHLQCLLSIETPLYPSTTPNPKTYGSRVSGVRHRNLILTSTSNKSEIASQTLALG